MVATPHAKGECCGEHLGVAEAAKYEEITMLGAVLYGPRDVRFEERDIPRITKPTDAIIRISATSVWI